MFLLKKTQLNQYSNQNRNILTTDMKIDLKNNLISEIHSDFNNDMYYFSIITSKSFFLYTRFYTKKEEGGSLKSTLYQRCIKSCIPNKQTKKEKSLYIQGFYENICYR